MTTIQPVDEKAFMPAWGSYLYSNFLLPSFSPSSSLDWLNPSASSQNNLSQPGSSVTADYFGLTATNQAGQWPPADTAAVDIKPAVIENTQQQQVQQHQQHQQQQLQQQRQQQLQQQQQQQQQQSGPSSFYPQPFYYPSSSTGISTSLLTQPPSLPLTLPSQPNSTDSVLLIDNTITRSPSPLSSHVVSPHASPILRAKTRSRGTRGSRGNGGVKRSYSLHSDTDSHLSHSHDDEHDLHDLHDHDSDHHEPEVPEGVERDGMIWGMKVEDYRALSARERKRVRNRISARTFRAKRKEHLTSLEHTLGAKDLQIKLANEETLRLRREVAELKKKLSKYEKPYDRPL
ncbi:hypothetical protein CI109_101054 [Kwoniella shandongensis]|uniref:Uncharacterized protein n=1 Tax=Kwoniella shandongensis TaxID=1734106 RepID=A0A5M6C4S0_9TREE|nr:uncharacterized protein CI109_001523 [Kwoniella shandongensis]KAA5530118.1 hypothetical protein CI109_001523 [Kwoniella shandongensis]